MAPSHEKPNIRLNRLISFFGASDQLEAPDLSFPGHRDIYTRSMARYDFVAPLIGGRLLDVGCGRGYGLQLIKASEWRVGLDVSFSFLAEAKELVGGVSLIQASGENLPFQPSSFNAIMAFEVIEHLQDDLLFLRELQRLAVKNAVIALSTPNRQIASGNAERPLNRFHVREYTPDEFRETLSKVFTQVDIYGQSEAGPETRRRANLIDRVPVRWKYILPLALQSCLSVVLRPPLKLEDCVFDKNDLHRAHTLVAICKPPEDTQHESFP